METGRQASTPKGKGKGKGTKQAAVAKRDNRTATPEIKKDEGVENPDKDALEPSVGDKDAEGEEVAPPAGDDEKKDGLDGEQSAEENPKGENENGEVAKPSVDIGEAGTGRFLDDALDRTRDNEKQAFQNMINESVKTENELKKVSAELVSTKELLEQKTTDLEAEQGTTEELRSKVHDLETSLAACQPPPEAEAEKPSAEAGAEKNEETTEQEESFITAEQKLRDLQLRLKRMASDEEYKDNYIRELTRQLKATEQALVDLEPHVDKVKLQEVMDKRRAALEQQEDDSVLLTDNIVRSTDGTVRSKVCIIM